MHGLMEQYPWFFNVFLVLCDSHGIQLLIKQILELPHYEKLVKQAQVIVASFAHSRL